MNLIKNDPDSAPIAERDKLIDDALQNFDQAIEKNPLSAQNHKDKAELLMLLPGKPVEIIEHLQKSMEINPYQLDTRLELADYLEKTGAGMESRRILIDGLSKSYVVYPGRALDFLRKIENLMDDDSTISSAHKRALRRQMAELARLGSASPTVQGVITFQTQWWPLPK